MKLAKAKGHGARSRGSFTAAKSLPKGAPDCFGRGGTVIGSSFFARNWRWPRPNLPWYGDKSAAGVAREAGASVGLGKHCRAVRVVVALGIATVALACSVDDRRFADRVTAPVLGMEAGSPGPQDGDAAPAGEGTGGAAPDLEMTDGSVPAAVSGGSGICDDDGNCRCDADAESCEPLPLCADAGASCDPICPGCRIGGECVGLRAENPDTICEICDPGRNALGWSNNDGVECNDELFCTTEDTCSGGRCEGAPLECEDGVACNGISTCIEGSDSCSPSVNQCVGGAVCSVAGQACVTECDGCLIAGVCLDAGAEEAGNPCRVCNPASSIDSYSAAVGKACGAAANDCSQRDTCDAQGICRANDLPADTACGDSASSDCDEPDACDGRGVCQARRVPNETSCEDGLFCTDGDSCQGGSCVPSGNRNCGANQACNEGANQCQCQGCVVGNVCFARNALDPNNTCRICDPSRSTTAFSANVGANCGSGPATCSAQDTCNAQGVCQPNHTSDSCNDNLFCTATDRCQNGACLGSGAACVANQTCNENSNQCVCQGLTLSCASPLGAGSGCGSWDFESDTLEGWELDFETPADLDAHVGNLDSSNAVPAPRGSRSLALRFQGTGSPGRTQVFIRVPLCQGGVSINLANRRLQALVRLVTDPGTNPLTTQQSHLVALYRPGEQFPIQSASFSVDPDTGGGAGPLGWHIAEADFSVQFGENASTSVTHLGFRFLVDSVWSGTVYVDDIRIL